MIAPGFERSIRPSRQRHPARGQLDLGPTTTRRSGRRAWQATELTDRVPGTVPLQDAASRRRRVNQRGRAASKSAGECGSGTRVEPSSLGSATDFPQPGRARIPPPLDPCGKTLLATSSTRDSETDGWLSASRSRVAWSWRSLCRGCGCSKQS